jgi:hypothetical protein
MAAALEELMNRASLYDTPDAASLCLWMAGSTQLARVFVELTWTMRFPQL